MQPDTMYPDPASFIDRVSAIAIDASLAFAAYVVLLQIDVREYELSILGGSPLLFAVATTVSARVFRGSSPGKRSLGLLLVACPCKAVPPTRQALKDFTFLFSAWAVSIGLAMNGMTSLAQAFGTALVLLALCDLLTSALRRDARTGLDVLFGTVVIRLPPLQPHRAPAGPMYSATDAEFGIPPRKDERKS